MAVDATCSRIMRIGPRRVRYLKRVEALEQTQEGNVCQIGESVRSAQTVLELNPEFARLRLS